MFSWAARQSRLYGTRISGPLARPLRGYGQRQCEAWEHVRAGVQLSGHQFIQQMHQSAGIIPAGHWRQRGQDA